MPTTATIISATSRATLHVAELLVANPSISDNDLRTAAYYAAHANGGHGPFVAGPTAERIANIIVAQYRGAFGYRGVFIPATER